MTAQLSRFQATHWTLVAAATLAVFVAGRPGAASVAFGGGLIGLITWLYAGAFRTIVERRPSRFVLGLVFVKVAAFLGLAWLAFAAPAEYRPDPMGFALGITCLPAAAVWEALRVRKH